MIISGVNVGGATTLKVIVWAFTDMFCVASQAIATKVIQAEKYVLLRKINFSIFILFSRRSNDRRSPPKRNLVAEILN